MEVKKAYTNDLGEIQPMLTRLLRPTESFHGQFSWLNQNPWDKEFDHFGYMLLNDNKKIVGFLGCLFSIREIRGNKYKFCNMTSWAVESDYRGHSLSLIMPLLELKEYTLTNFTPTDNVQFVLDALGFKKLDTSRKMFITFPPVFTFLNKILITFDKKEIAENLTGSELKIFKDHERSNCLHCLLINGNQKTYVIVEKITLRNKPFGYIHHISDLDIFLNNIGRIKWSFLQKKHIFSLFTDSRLIGNRRTCLTLNREVWQNKFYRSACLEANDIDDLYSEHFLH